MLHGFYYSLVALVGTWGLLVGDASYILECRSCEFYPVKELHAFPPCLDVEVSSFMFCFGDRVGYDGSCFVLIDGFSNTICFSSLECRFVGCGRVSTFA